mgnify:CR=1 FL=1
MSVSPAASEPLIPILTREGLALLNSLDPALAATPAAATDLTLALRKAEHAPELVNAVVHQLALRSKAAAKFGPFASTMLFTRPGLEQATRLAVAARHAQRFVGAGVSHVADLGCGIGADSLAMASLGLRVTSVEADETTAAVTTMNLMPFPEARVVHGDATTLDLEGIDGVWLDPARRDEGSSGTRRLFDPEAFSPPLSFVESLADQGRAVGVKLGPGIPHDGVPATAEAVWLSDGGDVVEATLYFNALARPGIRRAAIVVRGERSSELTASTWFPGLDPEAAVLRGEGLDSLGAFLYEPDGAVIRAGLVADLAEQIGAHGLDEHIANETGDTEVSTPFASGYRVIAVHPLKTKVLKAWAKEKNIGRLDVKKRGVDVTPEQLRRELMAGRGKIKNGAAATLVLTRIGERRVAIEVEPLA